MERTQKYLEYLRQMASTLEDSSIEEKYRFEAFRMAATPKAAGVRNQLLSEIWVPLSFPFSYPFHI